MEEEPREVNIGKDELVDRDGLKYEVNSAEPFTGIAVAYYPNGQKGREIHYRNGKEHGKSIFWWENGQKASENEYREGEEISEKCWNETGQPMSSEEHLDYLCQRLDERARG